MGGEPSPGAKRAPHPPKTLPTPNLPPRGEKFSCRHSSQTWPPLFVTKSPFGGLSRPDNLCRRGVCVCVLGGARGRRPPPPSGGRGRPPKAGAAAGRGESGAPGKRSAAAQRRRRRRWRGRERPAGRGGPPEKCLPPSRSYPLCGSSGPGGLFFLLTMEPRRGDPLRGRNSCSSTQQRQLLLLSPGEGVRARVRGVCVCAREGAPLSVGLAEATPISNPTPQIARPPFAS